MSERAALSALYAFVDSEPVSFALAAVIVPVGLVVWLGFGLWTLAPALWGTVVRGEWRLHPMKGPPF